MRSNRMLTMSLSHWLNAFAKKEYHYFPTHVDDDMTIFFILRHRFAVQLLCNDKQFSVCTLFHFAVAAVHFSIPVMYCIIVAALTAL